MNTMLLIDEDEKDEAELSVNCHLARRYISAEVKPRTAADAILSILVHIQAAILSIAGLGTLYIATQIASSLSPMREGTETAERIVIVPLRASSTPALQAATRNEAPPVKSQPASPVAFGRPLPPTGVSISISPPRPSANSQAASDRSPAQKRKADKAPPNPPL